MISVFPAPSSSTPSDWTVFLGRLRQNGSNPNEESVGVANITLSSLSGENVAMVQLNRKPTLSNFIQPVCVEQNAGAIATGTTCWVAGWGNAQAGGVCVCVCLCLCVCVRGWWGCCV